ncbi:MAG: hypothetical protein GXO99_07895, partial [Nitrospirae bacterium]|nr:hypothetical protein [Nitrospirota bacterium]
MKKITIVLGIFGLLVFSTTSYGFDNLGIIPVQPNGVFSTLSAYTIGKDKTGVMFSTERSIDPSFYRFSLVAEHGVTDNMEILISAPFITGYKNTEGLD